MQEPKISKLKGIYLSDSSLVFQSWFKAKRTYVEDHHITKTEVVQLVKEFMTDHVWLQVEFYMGVEERE